MVAVSSMSGTNSVSDVRVYMGRFGAFIAQILRE